LDFQKSGGGTVMCCQTGEFYNLTSRICVSCAIGQYNGLVHVTEQLPRSCQTCPRNTFAPIPKLPDCTECESEYYR
jgi:hypothetical protein